MPSAGLGDARAAFGANATGVAGEIVLAGFAETRKPPARLTDALNDPNCWHNPEKTGKRPMWNGDGVKIFRAVERWSRGYGVLVSEVQTIPPVRAVKESRGRSFVVMNALRISALYQC